MADVPKLVAIDMETYYDKEYSLSKLTTEQYVRDPRFQAIGAGIKFGDYPTDWIEGPKLRKTLDSIDWSDKMVLAHNTAFDGAILSWHYGVQPAMWLDTMSMARPKHGLTCGVSLAALAKHYELGEKGTEVVQAMGKRFEDFTPAELAQYGRYCINDAELEYALFKILVKGFPVNELRVIDMMLRMFINPVLELDKPKLEQHLANVKARKAELMARIEVEKEVLMSDDKFAAALEALGVEPPTKLSAAKSKKAGHDVYTWAFAKTDTDFIELQEHDDLEVQALVAARLGNKTTIEETRTERLIGISERGTFPIMLNYYGGHTGRASGGDKVNPQNYSTERNNKGGEIRAAITAPDDHVVCAGDSSQIECRTEAYMAGQQDLLEDFRRKRDIYSLFATDIYGREITKANKTERHVGKTCLAADTLLITSRGTIPIVDVKTTDLLWDGVEWVSHGGLLEMGTKPVAKAYGLRATDDHEILTGRGWLPWHQVRSNLSLFESALASANSKFFGGNGSSLPADGRSGTTPSADALAGGRGSSPDRICSTGGPRDAMHAQRSQLERSAGGSTKPHYQTTHTACGCSTGCRRPLLGVTLRATMHTLTMVAGAFKSTSFGATTGVRSFATCSAFPDGTSPNWTSTGQTTIRAISREISALLQRARTWATSNLCSLFDGAFESLRQKCKVYDVANAGPRNRFAVMTERGPLLVHNCILGLGFQTGAKKLRHTLASKEPRVYVDLETAKSYVDTYRMRYHRIPMLWTHAEQMIEAIHFGTGPYWIGPGDGVIYGDSEGIHLPNGMLIRYPGLEYDGKEYTYLNRKKRAKLYGGACTENFIQALARIIVFDQMLEVDKRLKARRKDMGWGHYRVVLSLHDEIVSVVPDFDAEWCKSMMEEIMSTPPAWAPTLPIACEVAYGKSYGDAK